MEITLMNDYFLSDISGLVIDECRIFIENYDFYLLNRKTRRKGSGKR